MHVSFFILIKVTFLQSLRLVNDPHGGAETAAAAAGQSAGKPPDLQAPLAPGGFLVYFGGREGRGELLLAVSQGFLQGRGTYLFPKQSSSVAAAGKGSPLSLPFSCCSLSSLEQDFTEAEDTIRSITEARTPKGLYLQGQSYRQELESGMFSSTALDLPDQYHSVSANSRCFHKAACHFGNLTPNVSQAMIKVNNKTRNELKQLIFNLMFYAPVLEFPASNYVQILGSQKQQSVTGCSHQCQNVNS